MEFRPAAPEDRGAIAALLAEAQRCDGRPALSEQKQVDFEGAGAGNGYVAVESGSVAGYAHAARVPAAWEVELALAPAYRSRERYGAFTRAVVARLDGADPVHVWSAQPDHGAALEDMGYEDFRELRQLRRRLPAPAPPPLPDGLRLASFVVGRDEDAWLATYRLAFASHPDGAGWDLAELGRRFARPWFEPGGFLLAWDGEDLAAFCWTKVHDDDVGEIYVIGVAPDHQGRHLGRIMVLSGLDHLHRSRGCRVGMLYVDADNASAVKLYSDLGFHEAAFSRCFLAKRG